MAGPWPEDTPSLLLFMSDDPDQAQVARSSLECATRPHLLQLLQYVSHALIEVRSYTLLFRVRQGVECLAEVSIDHGFDRSIVASVREMVAANQGDVLGSHVLRCVSVRARYESQNRLTISKVDMKSTSSIDTNGIRAPTAPEMVV